MELEESKDNSSTEKSLKRYASSVFEESTIGIVSSIAQITSTKRKTFKLFVLIVCLTGFLYHSGTYLSFFFQYPTAVYTDVLSPDTCDIPAYTFCDNNRVNRRIFCEKFPNLCEEPGSDICDKYPSYCGENRTLKPKKEIYNKYNHLTIEEIIRLNKLDVSYTNYGSDAKDEKITGPYFRVRDDEAVYPCCSLNDRVNKSLLPLTSDVFNFLKSPITEFDFKVKADEVFLPGNRAGIIFTVHSPFEAVEPFQDGIFLRPGRSYIIYVSVDETILEKGPYETDCINHTEFWGENARSGPRSEKIMSGRERPIAISPIGRHVDNLFRVRY